MCLRIVFVVAYRKDTKELSAVVGIWLDSSKEAFALCHVWYLSEVCGSFVQTTSSIWQPMLREGRPIYLFYRKDLSLLIDASFVFLYKLEWILLNNNINVNNLIKIDISLIDPRGNRSAQITIKATLLISYAKEDSIS